jgi:hypothetical protein
MRRPNPGLQRTRSAPLKPAVRPHGALKNQTNTMNNQPIIASTILGAAILAAAIIVAISLHSLGEKISHAMPPGTPPVTIPDTLTIRNGNESFHVSVENLHNQPFTFQQAAK